MNPWLTVGPVLLSVAVIGAAMLVIRRGGRPGVALAVAGPVILLVAALAVLVVVLTDAPAAASVAASGGVPAAEPVAQTAANGSALIG
ncbi:MAG: hypothetical protein WAL50_12990, partial [Kineosporiaceae bacterium]